MCTILALGGDAFVPTARPAARISSSRLVMAESFSVTFVAPDGSERVLGVPDNEYILDRAEEKGIELPYSCRAGACCECIGKVIEGDVDNSDAAFLDEDQLEEGWRLLCTAYATTDAKVLTHQKEEFLGL